MAISASAGDPQGPVYTASPQSQHIPPDQCQTCFTNTCLITCKAPTVKSITCVSGGGGGTVCIRLVYYTGTKSIKMVLYREREGERERKKESERVPLKYIKQWQPVYNCIVCVCVYMLDSNPD